MNAKTKTKPGKETETKAPGATSPPQGPADGLAVTFRPLDSLANYARNARTHDDGQMAQLMGSMLEWGFTNPILADGAGIVAGHGRCAAARRLYESGKTLRLPNGTPIPVGMVPVLDVSGWSEAKRRAYILADNKLALNAGWNFEMLAVELDDLRDLDFDLSAIGFNQQELNEMIGTPRIPPPPGADDHESLNTAADGSRSGVFIESLKFGNNEVNITADELSELEKKLAQYVKEFGVSFGFAAWLCEGRSDA